MKKVQILTIGVTEIMMIMNEIIIIRVNITTIQNRIITTKIMLKKETIITMRSMIIMKIEITINQKKNILLRNIMIIILKIEIRSPTKIIIEKIIRTTLGQKI